MQCVRHPKVETYVQCGRCDQPICPDCMVPGPVGVRCRACSRRNEDQLLKGTPRQYALALVFGIGSGLALGGLPHMIPWLGIISGYLVGEATLRGGGRKRGLVMQAIAGLAAALGFAAWGSGPHGLPDLMALLSNPFNLIGAGLSIFFAVSHVRYI
jgi:thiol:disulfide interchange protein